jgi:hypothetical protein
MTPSTTETPVAAAELAEAVVEALTRKGPALTVSQVRDNLPRRCRLPNADIGRCLDELVAQGKAHSWPAYRSKSARYGVQPMEVYARATLTRLLGEHAFTPAELVATVREEVPGLPEEQCRQMVEEVMASGQVRKLPPRLGSNIHLIGTPHPRAYLAPLFEGFLKGLDKLFVRLETEGVARNRVLEEVRELWQEVVREAEKDAGPSPVPEAETKAETPPAPAVPTEPTAAAETSAPVPPSPVAAAPISAAPPAPELAAPTPVAPPAQAEAPASEPSRPPETQA